MEYGYARISTREQNEERQLIALREFGRNDGQIILDKQSGKDFDRRGYRRLLQKIERRRHPCHQEHRPSRAKL